MSKIRSKVGTFKSTTNCSLRSPLRTAAPRRHRTPPPPPSLRPWLQKSDRSMTFPDPPPPLPAQNCCRCAGIRRNPESGREPTEKAGPQNGTQPWGRECPEVQWFFDRRGCMSVMAASGVTLHKDQPENVTRLSHTSVAAQHRYL